MKSFVFWIFGILQSVSLGFVIFLLFKQLNTLAGGSGIGTDTTLVLSIAFPLFLLLVEYAIYSGKPE